MQGQLQLPKPTPEKPTKTIHLWRIAPQLPRPRQNAPIARFQSRHASVMTQAMSPNGRDKVVEFDHFVTKSPWCIFTTMYYAMRMVGKWPRMKAEQPNGDKALFAVPRLLAW